MISIVISDTFHTACNLMNTSDVNLFNSVVKLVLSALLGSIIGYERKGKGQAAGVGTFSLISVGATLAMILSIYIPQEYLGLKNGDPGRLAAQVITGIGFLGAGTIIRTKGSIKGLTTAAGIWAMAMVGMAIGCGLYWVGIITTVLILTVFVYFGAYEQYVNLGWKSKTLSIECSGTDVDVARLRNVLQARKIKVVDTFLKQDYRNGVTVVSFMILIKSHYDMLSLFDEIKENANVMTIMIDSDKLI